MDWRVLERLQGMSPTQVERVCVVAVCVTGRRSYHSIIRWTNGSYDLETIARAMVRLDRPVRRIGVQRSGCSPSGFAFYDDDGIDTTKPPAPIDLAYRPLVDPEVVHLAHAALDEDAGCDDSEGSMCIGGSQEIDRCSTSTAMGRCRH